jgi:CTP:phosphocholine cytidylyltransferase-like protein/thiamine kinase-like enzyme/biotin operon repressor
MLSASQFEILNTLYKNSSVRFSQRDLSRKTGMSLGKINACVTAMREEGFLTAALSITRKGFAALKPYKVDNAVIMAAGMSTRFAPLSYEKPKALLEVKGEILIEREIRQLKEAGINDITIVVGYMKEKLFYLADKFNVNIVVNEDYYRYNNPSSLILILDKLKNTYVCSSDDYFSENVFETYVYRPYYSAVYSAGKTDEYCLKTNRSGLITGVTIGGADSWYMLGHVYFSREFSSAFSRILKKEYESPETKSQLWESLYMRHLSELKLYIRKYDSDRIAEFDSLDELRAFDTNYIKNVNSRIFTNIESVLKCSDSDITDIHPIKTGLTNVSFYFSCKGIKYVYRHPGVGTEVYINRKSEAASMKIAKKLGLDDTFIYMDPKEGWKISYYLEGCHTLKYHSRKETDEALKLIRTLHASKTDTGFRFDIWGAIAKFESTLAESGRTDFSDLADMHADMEKIHRLVDKDRVPKCLCHGDCYDPNFLIDPKGKMYLIDWEYSGMADPACDLGTFISCSDYDMKKADETIGRCLGHKPSAAELRHYLAYVAILAYYWFVWAIYQDSVGKTVGEYLYIWYRYTKSYSKRALMLYEDKITKKGKHNGTEK